MQITEAVAFGRPSKFRAMVGISLEVKGKFFLLATYSFCVPKIAMIQAKCMLLRITMTIKK